MLTEQNYDQLVGRNVVTNSGDKVGTVSDVYADIYSGHPSFATVKTGMFGSRSSFVPLQEAQLDGDALVVPYEQDQIKDAPHVDPEDELSPAAETEIYRHYGLTHETGPTTTAGHDTSGPDTDDAMTRSEERLQVGTERELTGVARLKKYVVTENVTTTVPVTREEVRVEREPITDANVDRAMGGPRLSEEEHEVVLTEERPVVTKETVPVERVRLAKETVTEQAQVSDEVAKERIDTEGV